MTKPTGTVAASSSEVAILAPRTHSIKKSFRAVGAAVISAAMVGVFALPVYATSSASVQQPDSTDAAFAQVLTTEALDRVSVPAHLPSAEEEPPVVVQVASSSFSAPSMASSGWVADVAASSLGLAIVGVAHSELGAMQDCTDLVQNSLAGVGLAERRDQGGYDHGTISLSSFGTPVTNGEWAPGDILGWPGYPHVAIYIGDGLAIHGGMGGSTVISSATGWFGTPSYVVRPG